MRNAFIAILILVKRFVLELELHRAEGAKDMGGGGIFFKAKGESRLESVRNARNGRHVFFRRGDNWHDSPEKILKAIAAQLG